jgi:hypothetical protein
MKDSAHPGLLLELADRLDRVTPAGIIAPKNERPDGAELLGYAPLSLQRTYTLYALLAEECESSPMAREETAATDAVMVAQKQRGISEEELGQHYMTVQIARAKLSAYETTLDLLWTLLLAEAARLFPSGAYVEHLVTIYSDWSVAVMPDEEDDDGPEDKEAVALLMAVQPPPPGRYN